MLDILIRDDVPLSLAPFDALEIEGRELFSAGPWGRTLVGRLGGGEIHLEAWLLPKGYARQQTSLTVRGTELGLFIGDEQLSDLHLRSRWDELTLRANPGVVEVTGDELRLASQHLGDGWRSGGGTLLDGLVRLSATELVRLRPALSPRGRLSALAERRPLGTRTCNGPQPGATVRA